MAEIVIASKRSKESTILKDHPGALIIDVTSVAADEFRQLSPFYPHGGIPVPNSDGMTATCVEAVWQGLKVFEDEDVDVTKFRNATMKNLKRTVRMFGKPKGHRYGVDGEELLGYIEARKRIYIPTYQWMLENKAQDVIAKLREKMAENSKIVLRDYNTSQDVDDAKKPLSHAYLVKAYVEGLYPFGEKREEQPAEMRRGEQLTLAF